MEGYLWPQVTPAENPIQHVTNGVHLHTFIARAWTRLFHDSFRGWRASVHDSDYWHCIAVSPYDRFVAVRRQLKSDLLIDLEARVPRRLCVNGVPATLLAHATRHDCHCHRKKLV